MDALISRLKEMDLQIATDTVIIILSNTPQTMPPVDDYKQTLLRKARERYAAMTDEQKKKKMEKQKQRYATDEEYRTRAVQRSKAYAAKLKQQKTTVQISL